MIIYLTTIFISLVIIWMLIMFIKIIINWRFHNWREQESWSSLIHDGAHSLHNMQNNVEFTSTVRSDFPFSEVAIWPISPSPPHLYFLTTFSIHTLMKYHTKQLLIVQFILSIFSMDNTIDYNIMYTNTTCLNSSRWNFVNLSHLLSYAKFPFTRFKIALQIWQWSTFELYWK